MATSRESRCAARIADSASAKRCVRVDAARRRSSPSSALQCHRVEADLELPRPVSASPGPDLGAALAARGAEYLATAIVSPSHEISLNPDDELVHDVDGLTSPMGDITRAMTVRQLVDLIAFLESLGD